MSRILITGSAQGLGRTAATALLDDGHQVVVHAQEPRPGSPTAGGEPQQSQRVPGT